MNLKKFKYFLLVAVLMYSIAIRFWSLGSVPLGFHEDEAAFGYNAYSILKTSKDEYGVTYPLILRSFGDYKAAIYSYLTIPFISIHGLNEWSVRAPSAVFGVIFVFIIFLLVRNLSGNFYLAIIAMILAAISPVGIILSRVQSDPLLSICIFYGSFYLWLVWVRKRNILLLICVIIGFLISYLSNTITRLYSIPFLVLYGLFYWMKWDFHVRKVFIALNVILVSALLCLSLFSSGERLNQVSVFNKADVQLLLDEDIREDTVQNVPFSLLKISHNKLTAYCRYLIKNYTDYLSFDFLFYQAKQPLREQVPGVGLLLLLELPFLLAGIYTIIRSRQWHGLFSILLIFLVPLVLSFASEETPNIHRFFLAMLPLHVVVASGILVIFTKLHERNYRTVIACIIVLFILNELIFLHQLFIHQPIHLSGNRQDDRVRLAHEIKSYYSTYDVIVSQKILEHILFFWPVNPELYQSQGSPRDTDNSWYEKFFFVTDACPSRLGNPKVRAITAKRILYIDKAECGNDPNDILVGDIKLGNSVNVYYLIEKTVQKPASL